MAEYEVYKDKDDPPQWRWHLKADNGEIVAQGESYTREEDARRGITDFQNAVKVADTPTAEAAEEAE